MPRKPKRLPDYFTAEEAAALVQASPSYQVRMAMRIMLRTGLRVSECLSLCASDLRLSQSPPIISLRPGVRGNKAKKGREIPIPADLVESLRDLASINGRERHRALLEISRQAISAGMKKAAEEAGIDPVRAHPHALRHTYGRNAVLNGVPTPVLQSWLGHATLKETERYVELAGAHHAWVDRL